jgi:DNA-binding NarL/FixJ family response regulator
MATDGDAAGLRGIRVMIAEDEAVVAFDLEFTLADFGCAVLPPVASVADALGLLARERPDVALLDVSLNDGPSTPVARELAAAGVPYAVTTGYDSGQLAEPLLRDAPQLGKPYQATELHDLLLRLTGRA